LLKRSENNDFIYIGCQILNKKLFEKYKIQNFSISEIWNELLKNNKLNGYESNNKFYHLTNLETFKKLKDF
jgi:MurNAc alpha-1-phosphate uridylyltransferase